MRMKRSYTLILILISLPLFLFAQGADEASAASRYDSYAGKTPMGPKIVASTSWVGAIAEAAGASQVQVLAPVELRHPPEYDFSPKDIISASQADLVLWAGYEGFVKNLAKAAGIGEERLVKVNTNNAPDQLAQSVEAIAQLLDTSDRYVAWKEELDVLASRLLAASAGQENTKKRAAVQFHHQNLARYLGYDVVYVFGPQELTLNDLRKVDELNPDTIIDNWHSVQGQSFATSERSYVQLINFPGPFGARSILDVLEYNGRQLGLLD